MSDEVELSRWGIKKNGIPSFPQKLGYKELFEISAAKVHVFYAFLNHII